LNVFVGTTPKRLVESAISGLPADSKDPANLEKGHPAQPERDDLLLAPCDVDLRLRCSFIAAGRSPGFICNVVYCHVIRMVTERRRLPQDRGIASAGYADHGGRYGAMIALAGCLRRVGHRVDSLECLEHVIVINERYLRSFLFPTAA
jgi:hypothetical protein